MEAWETVLNKFLAEWKEKDEVVGAVLAGSYATGSATDHSDIDIHIVLADNVDWRERGNKIVDGFLIEYFANPVPQIKKYFEDEHQKNRRTCATMYAAGKILFDKNETVQTLQSESKEFITKPFRKQSDAEVEILKYYLWDQLDNLKELNLTKSPIFNYAYFKALSKIIDVYAGFLQVEIAPPSKIYKYYTDEGFRKKYLIDKFPDDNFTDLAVECLVRSDYSNIEKLTEYTFDQMDEFNIDGWKLHSKVEE